MAWKKQKPPSGIPAGGKSIWGGANGLREEFPPGYVPPTAFTPHNQPPPEHKSIGRMEAKEYRDALKARREKGLAIIDKLFDAALAEEADVATLVAAARQVDVNDSRIDGRPTQPVSGDEDKGPLTVVLRRFVEDVPE
jgi:hypothetical protein